MASILLVMVVRELKGFSPEFERVPGFFYLWRKHKT